MIKVLIVEDDKLVRKSLISTFRWDEYEMEIVGEAKNGLKALEFIEKQPVDLIITDLAMPIMSGIELIRVVKAKWPAISVVVLSLHRDFEYIQEAMRLGAIDYIAKIELDEDNMEDILYRIQQRIEKENPIISSEVQEKGFTIISEQADICRKIFSEIMDEQNIRLLHHACFFLKTDQFTAQELADYIIQSNQSVQSLLCITPHPNNKAIDANQLHVHYDDLLFYELDQDLPIVIKSAEQIVLPSYLTKEQLDQWKRQLQLLDWVAEESQLYTMLDKLQDARLTKHQLEDLLLSTMNRCNRIFDDLLSSEIPEPVPLNYWGDAESWFIEVRQQIYLEVYSAKFTPETNQCIIQALSIIEKELAYALTANEVAEQVNMSRSYFSRCFKEITGQTFNEYVRVARINKAKRYLQYTREKVGVIAEKVGYIDMKYFSHIFRKETGLLPSEYRKLNQKWDK